MSESAVGSSRWELVKCYWRLGDWLRHPTHIAAMIHIPAVAIACTLMIWHGDVFLDHRDKHFGERELGTFLSFGLLLWCAVLCRLTWKKTRDFSFSTFWNIAMIGYVMLACDELLRIHERLDHWFHAIFGLDENNPITDHLDDVIVASYPLFALWLAWKFRFHLLALRWLVIYMAVAGVMFAAMVVADIRGTAQWLEESFKILSAACMVPAVDAARRDPRLLEIARTFSRPNHGPVMPTTTTTHPPR